jgi:hypothetical protein
LERFVTVAEHNRVSDGKDEHSLAEAIVDTVREPLIVVASAN